MAKYNPNKPAGSAPSVTGMMTNAQPQTPQAPAAPKPPQAQTSAAPQPAAAGKYKTGLEAAQGINTELGGKDLQGSAAQFQKWIDEGRQNPDGTWKSSKMCNGQPCPDSGDHPDACPPGWAAHGIDECRPTAGGGAAGGGGGGMGPRGGGPGGGGMTGMFPYDPNQFAQFQGQWNQLSGGPVADPTGDFYRKILGGGPNPFEALMNQKTAEQAKQNAARLSESGATGGQLALGTVMGNQQLNAGAAQNQLNSLQPALGYLGDQSEAAKNRNAAQQQAAWGGFMQGQGLGLNRELGLGELALGNRNAGINERLGLGNLALGQGNLDLDWSRFGEQQYQNDLGYGVGQQQNEYNLLNQILGSNQGINDRRATGMAQGNAAIGQGFSSIAGAFGG